MVTIAVGMVTAREQLETDQLENFVMVGELALNGAVRSVTRLGRSRIGAHSRALGSGGVNEGAASVVFEVQPGCMAGPGLSLRAWDSTGRGSTGTDLRGRSSEREAVNCATRGPTNRHFGARP